MSSAALESPRPRQNASRIKARDTQGQKVQAKQGRPNLGRPSSRTMARRTQPASRPQQVRRLDPVQVARKRRAQKAAALQKAQEAARRAQQHEAESETRADDWHFSLELMFVYFSCVVAIAMAVVFGLDLLTGIPFQRASVLFDVTNAICGIAILYLCWNTHRDLV